MILKYLTTYSKCGVALQQHNITVPIIPIKLPPFRSTKYTNAKLKYSVEQRSGNYIKSDLRTFAIKYH